MEREASENGTGLTRTAPCACLCMCGGVQIQALSRVLQRPIHVVQATGPVVATGDHYGPPVLSLSYHRHAYRLGEHYNSLHPAS